MTGTGAGRRHYVQEIWCGSYEYLKTMKVRDEKKLTGKPNKKYLQSTMTEMGMSDCKGSVSPKLDKASMDGDNEEIDEEQTARFRSSVLALLYLSNERTEIQSTVRFLCTKLKSTTALEMRQLKRLLRYVKGTEDMATMFEVRDNNDKREQLVKKLDVFTDSDWASDQMTRKRKSTSAVCMRLHAHSRGQASVALSSCEAEVTAASEGIKEALLLQEVLMFAGLGHYVIEVKVDSSAAHAFFHRRGVGRMRHADSRVLWLQDLIAVGGVKLKKMARTQNLAEMLTHTPSVKELEVFRPLMRLQCCSDRDKELVTRQYKPVPIKIETRNDGVRRALNLWQGRVVVVVELVVHQRQNLHILITSPQGLSLDQTKRRQFLSFFPSFSSFLLSFFPSFLLSFFPSFLLSFFPSFLLSFFPSFLLSFFPSLLLYFFTSLLLYFFLCLHFFSSLLHYFFTSLPLYCFTLLLFFVLLFLYFLHFFTFKNFLFTFDFSLFDFKKYLFCHVVFLRFFFNFRFSFVHLYLCVFVFGYLCMYLYLYLYLWSVLVVVLVQKRIPFTDTHTFPFSYTYAHI